MPSPMTTLLYSGMIAMPGRSPTRKSRLIPLYNAYLRDDGCKKCTEVCFIQLPIPPMIGFSLCSVAFC